MWLLCLFLLGVFFLPGCRLALGYSNNRLFGSRLFGSALPFPSSTVQNPPFFPRSIEELASDCVFQTKLGLISNEMRVRVDLSTRMTGRLRTELEFLLTYSRMLLDDDLTHVHVFVGDRYNLEYTQALWSEMAHRMTGDDVEAARKLGEKLSITPISDSYLPSFDDRKSRRKKDKAGALQARAFVLFEPNNLAQTNTTVNLLEEVEALCFHAALRKIPVVMINPVLVTGAWGDSLRDSMLLGDFRQVYFVHDDYLHLENRGRCCGLIQRAATGNDLFLLDGLGNSGAAVNTTRLKSWPLGEQVQVRAAITQALLLHEGNDIEKSMLGLTDYELSQNVANSELSEKLQTFISAWKKNNTSF